MSLQLRRVATAQAAVNAARRSQARRILQALQPQAGLTCGVDTVKTDKPVRIPSDLQVTLSDIDHGYMVQAQAQVCWGREPAENGGPLSLTFHGDALVILTPSGSGSSSLLCFRLRGVDYNVRAELYRQEDGTYDLGRPGTRDGTRASVDRAHWQTVNEMHASDAARRDVTAILREVGLQVLKARPDLMLAGAVARKRAEAIGARKRADEAVKAMQAAMAEASAAEEALREADMAMYDWQQAQAAQEVTA